MNDDVISAVVTRGVLRYFMKTMNEIAIIVPYTTMVIVNITRPFRLLNFVYVVSKGS